MENPTGRLITTQFHRESVLPGAVGDYLHSERDLYRVEHLDADRALLEDCKTGNLIEVPLASLLDLKRVRAD